MYATEGVREHVIFRARDGIGLIGQSKLFEAGDKGLEVLISEGTKNNSGSRLNSDTCHHSEQQAGEKPVIELT